MLASNNTDKELIAAYLAGEESALEILIRRHKDKVYYYILSKVKDEELAEDLFQDTFIKIINTLKTDRYNEEGKFINWAMRIAHNLTIDYFRKAAKKREVHSTDEFDVFNLVIDNTGSAEFQMITEQTQNDLVRLIEELPEDQKCVLKMRIYEDLSFKEIAEQTDVSINTALGRMRYALINLRKLADKYSIVLTA
jgi:RNA polymerase sigma-70 factor (ECF subfamily)